MTGKTRRSVFDVQRFGAWLRRYGEAEHLKWSEVTAGSGVTAGTLYTVMQGKSPGAKSGGDPTNYDPTITTLANIAKALDLDLGYVISKGGVPITAPRATLFTPVELALLYRALGIATATDALLPSEDTPAARLREELAHELQRRTPAAVNNHEGADV